MKNNILILFIVIGIIILGCFYYMGDKDEHFHEHSADGTHKPQFGGDEYGLRTNQLPTQEEIEYIKGPDTDVVNQDDIEFIRSGDIAQTAGYTAGTGTYGFGTYPSKFMM
jgi:hypothetical protein